jgi:hypothetical protein
LLRGVHCAVGCRVCVRACSSSARRLASRQLSLCTASWLGCVCVCSPSPCPPPALRGVATAATATTATTGPRACSWPHARR